MVDIGRSSVAEGQAPQLRTGAGRETPVLCGGSGYAGIGLQISVGE
jgi:hypothetical protein